MPPTPSLRAEALAVLCIADPADKLARTHALWARWRALGAHDAAAWDTATPLQPTPSVPLPGRPERPVLVPPGEVPQRSPFTREGLAALLHAIAHIEFNAIHLALDAVWRFAGMPVDFYRQWLQVAHEEATHFGLLNDHLTSLGFAYGDCLAHNGLWEMCVKTQHDVTARMALVPRTLEARGLDVTPGMIEIFRKAGEQQAIDALEVIYAEEVGHVAYGSKWFNWLCGRDGEDPKEVFHTLVRKYFHGSLKPPFNVEKRAEAGLPPDFYWPLADDNDQEP